MSKKKVRIVEDVEVLTPLKNDADYWMSCKKPFVVTFNIVLIVSLFRRRPFMTSLLLTPLWGPHKIQNLGSYLLMTRFNLEADEDLEIL